jgi:hypothetical protein
MNKYYYFLLVLCLAFFVSCKTVRKATVIKLKHISKEELITITTKKNPSFDAISIKYNATIEKDNSSNSINGTIRILRDSAIWITINAALGIEVARGLFLRDTFKLINFHEKLYYFGNYNTTKKMLGSELDYTILQSVLTSTFLLPTAYQPANIQETIIENEAGEFELSERFKDFTSNLKIDSNSYKIKELKIAKALSPISMQVSYNKYITIDGRIFPQEIIIKSKDSNSKTIINLNYNKITLDKEIKIPFRVPQRFDVIPLNK